MIFAIVMPDKTSLKIKNIKPKDIEINNILKKLSFLLNLLAKPITIKLKIKRNIGLNISLI